MRVVNIHQRVFPMPPDRVGSLIDSLAAPDDRLWPKDLWPPMAFDRALMVGAVGGHGPIRYRIEEYQPCRNIRFRFLGPTGLDGYHEFSVIEDLSGGTTLRHVIEMRVHGPALLSWPIIFKPLHDALLEDSLARAQAFLGQVPTVVKWPAWVRFLRWTFSAGRARTQIVPPVRTSGEPSNAESH